MEQADKRLFNKDRKDTKDMRRSRPSLNDVWNVGAEGAVFTVQLFTRRE